MVDDYEALYAVSLPRSRPQKARPATPTLDRSPQGEPASALTVVSEYLRSDRHDAAPSDPLFLVGYATVAGKVIVRRLSGRRVWTLVRDLGERSGIKGLHPHALRHACAVELLKRTKNLRAVQQHLRHRDIHSTTFYARLMPDELAEAANALDS